MVAMVVAIMVEVFNQFAQFFVNTKGQPALSIPRCFHIEVGEG
jgi:hypothetical protein